MKALLVAALVALITTLGCSVERADPVGIELGGPCDQLLPCEGALLCVDGRCLERPWPPAPTATEGASQPIDIVVARDGEADAGGDALVDGERDSGGEEAERDGASAGDGGDDADGDGAVVIFIGAHDAARAPSDDTLTLQAEQAAVAQLFLPAAGTPRALEVLAKDPIGGQGCGRFRPALWVASPEGQFPTAPLWQGEAVAIAGEANPQQLALAGAPKLSAGALRAGLIFEALCPGATRQPLMVTDASGQVDGTWVWVNLGGSAAWIDGATLRLSGRWALRLGVEPE